MNHEGVLIDWLHEAYVAGAKAVLLNAGGYTHTSIAIHDAIKSIKVPVIEVHLSDPTTREAFRHRSEEHTSELQSLMRLSDAVFCLIKKPHLISRLTHTTPTILTQ